MVVAVHQHGRLRERLRREPVEGRRDRRALARVGREREVAREEPLREQLHLAHQDLAVVGRQRRGIARLQAHERVDRVRIERLRACTLPERLEVMLPAEVAHQHEALLRVHGENLRHVHAGRGEDARDPEPRVEALAFGGRVHRDLSAAAAMHAEVTPEARVGGRGRDALDGRARQARDPSFEFQEPWVRVVVRCHAGATAGVPAL